MLASVSPEKHPVLQDRAEFPRVYKELEYNRRILYLVTLSFKYLSEQSKQKKKRQELRTSLTVQGCSAQPQNNNNKKNPQTKISSLKNLQNSGDEFHFKQGVNHGRGNAEPLCLQLVEENWFLFRHQITLKSYFLFSLPMQLTER